MTVPKATDSPTSVPEEARRNARYHDGFARSTFRTGREWPGSPQSFVSFGCRLPPARPETQAWQAVFAQALRNTLDEIARRRTGISYGFKSSYDQFRGGATQLMAGALVTNDSLATMVSEISTLVGQLGEGRWAYPDPTATQEVSRQLDMERWQYVTKQLSTLGTSAGLARELFHAWNMGWPVDGGRMALTSLTHMDARRDAAIARQCHDSAAIVVAAPARALATIGAPNSR